MVLMQQAAPRTRPTWIPAHKTKAEYAARGLGADIWEGSDLADKRAKSAAAEIRVSRQTREQRAGVLSALALAQRVISAIQCKVLDVKHADKRARARAHG